MFDPELAAIRFGTGLAPQQNLVGSPDEILSELSARDQTAERFPIAGIYDLARDLIEYRRLNKAKRTDDDARDALRQLRRKSGGRHMKWLTHHVARWMSAPIGFRERLTAFWADHFTVVGKSGLLTFLASTHAEDAIRPHLSGRFEDMLIAAVTHPMMLAYLDQPQSIGEGSPVAKRSGKGLNENLAREILELHTLGAGGAYSQTDVREFAKLLAGYSFDRDGKVIYAIRRGSPGAETILGKSYGGKRPDVKDVHRALRDIARHPDTARHIARKLAVHFVSDAPDQALVDHITAAYRQSHGDLSQCYAALLEHPSAWVLERTKIKRPFDFIATALRALGTDPAQVAKSKYGQTLNLIAHPMQLMGQHWQRPDGPDGWPEEGAHWITPHGLAARVQWSMTVPNLLGRDLPDPREFVTQALGSHAGREVRFAAKAAETRWEGIGLILSSPDFQSR